MPRRALHSATIVAFAGLFLLAGHAPARGAGAPAADRVAVNRTVPRVAPPPLAPRFSASPTAEEIRAARVFSEPVVAIGGAPTAEQSKSLAAAMTAFLGRGQGGDEGAVEEILGDGPENPYAASVLLNLGLHDRQRGAFTRALHKLELAWTLAKDATDPEGVAVADRAAAEWADLYLRFGDMEGLAHVFSEVEGRTLSGSSGQKLALAREGFFLLHHHHDQAVPSARTALRRVLVELHGAGYQEPAELEAFPATMDGASLLDVRGLSQSIAQPFRVVQHEDGPIPVPSVALLRVKHFSAVVRKEGNRYLIDDPCLGAELWVSEEVLLAEGTGYYLVPEDRPTPGFRDVPDAEAALHRGKCYPLLPDPDGPKPGDPAAGGSCPLGKGMARWGIYKLHASLHLSDNPVGYSPPRGPSVELELDYNQRETHQPALFPFSNVGPLWTHRWLAYLEDDPTNPAAVVTFYLPGGGVEIASGYDASTSSYARDFETRAQLVRTSTSPIRYERRSPDGSIEVFAQPDGASTSPRRIFRTESIDPQGQKLTFTYDGSLRLVAITDAIGQVTTLAYELPGDPSKITKVTDPFGRFATLEYDAAGRLVRITDVLGLASEFEYVGNGFLTVLETPYGRTEFAGDPFGNPNDDDLRRWVEVTDPLGGKERVEYVDNLGGFPASEPAAPFGFAAHNVDLYRQNSFYWDKRAMSLYPGDYTKAEISHWLQKAHINILQYIPVAQLHSTKRPLESRVWMKYVGQPLQKKRGTSPNPSQVARLMDDGSTQAWSYDYNEQGSRTFAADPLGRTTLYVYEANGLDLKEIRQVVAGGAQELVQSFTYNAQRLPLTITDAAGQTTTYTYLADGRPQTIVTPARDGLTLAERTTTYGYYPDNDPVSPGRLQSVAGPNVGAQAGPSTTYVYDVQGRLHSVTQLPDNYTVTTDYDALDRPVKVTYPDGTFEETLYHRLDAVSFRDRLGRWSSTSYDALRRPVTTTDPMGNTVMQRWCDCGSLERLVDANGNATIWETDLQGRVVQETWANGKFRSYVYEASTSRLASVTDPKNQTILYGYDLDDKLVSISYQNEVIETPDVTFSYRIGGQPLAGPADPYGRLIRVTDGIGVTNYGYHPVGGLGAVRLASIDGPLTDDTISYVYDELGRAESRSIGTGNVVTWSFDSLGRLTNETNVLGSFDFTYDSVTSRLTAVDYPNSQRASYAYYPPLADSRLQQIHNHVPSTSTTISKFDYTYDAAGNILTWQQQADADPPVVYTYGHDRADRLTSAILRSTGGTPTILKRYGYAYDPAGNRTAEQIDDAVTESLYDNVNRLMLQRPGGVLLFRGSTNEPASVTIGGIPATTTATNEFSGQAQVGSGTSSVEIKATDSSGNLRTNTYEVSQTGATKTFTWDDNGNLVSDGTRDFEWDAENRLVAVEVGNRRSEFAYGAAGLRSRIAEKQGGAVFEDHQLTWCGGRVCDQRAPSGAIEQRFFASGLEHSGSSYFYSMDHLQSVREASDLSGTVRVRYDFQPFGARTQVSGGVGIEVGFTSYHEHEPSDLSLAPRRPLDASLGRWMNPDPAGFADGTNLYLYALNDPLNRRDPTGLKVVNLSRCRVFVKPSEWNTAQPLEPGDTWPVAQDGVAVPESEQGRVFKSTAGVNLWVSKGGGVHTLSTNWDFGGALTAWHWFFGGWKDKAWLATLQAQGDTGWDALFAASETKPVCLEERNACHDPRKRPGPIVGSSRGGGGGW